MASTCFSRFEARHVLLAALGVPLLLLAACDTTKPEEQPAFRKAVAVEERVAKVENQADALVSVSADVEGLKSQVRFLTGQTEDLRHQLALQTQEARAVRADSDARLKELETKLKSLEAKVIDNSGNTDLKPETSKLSDKDAYQSALNFFKQKDFSGCASAFDQFLATYLDSTLLDNALFWAGACRYSDNRLGEAMGLLTKLLRDHPDSRKVPDALMVMARAEADLKRPKEATETLKRLIKDYPDAAVIAEAKSKLKSLESNH